MLANNEKWYLWKDINRSPMFNMAIDESLLPEIAAMEMPLLRIYGWDRPAVSIGYVQKYSAAPQEGYTVVRRPTGGGVVFHDVDLTYTIVVPFGHRIKKENRLESYHIFHRIIIKALASLNIASSLVKLATESANRSTMHCFTSPSRYDVVLNDSIGKGQIKVAGAAQRRTKYGILHQGSIALNMLEPSCTLRAHAKIPCLGKVQGREQQSIVPKARSETRITDDIASKRKRFTKSLLSAFTQELNINFIDFQPSPNFLFSSKRLSEGKYATEKWNRHRKG